MDFKIEKVESHNDPRGKLIILLKKSDLSKKDRVFGEVFYITFSKKGITRANHYHKKWREWFVVVSGKLQVFLKDVKTGKTANTIIKNGKTTQRLEIGPYVAHAFKALSDNTALLNYSDGMWNPEDVITYELIPAKINAKK